MAIRVDADTAIGMLSDIETEWESEDSLYGNLDSDDSVSSREEYDDEPENDNVSDENKATLDDSSDKSSDEEPEDTTATRGRAAQRGRGTGGRVRGTG